MCILKFNLDAAELSKFNISDKEYLGREISNPNSWVRGHLTYEETEVFYSTMLVRIGRRYWINGLEVDKNTIRELVKPSQL